MKTHGENLLCIQFSHVRVFQFVTFLAESLFRGLFILDLTVYHISIWRFFWPIFWRVSVTNFDFAWCDFLGIILVPKDCIINWCNFHFKHPQSTAIKQMVPLSCQNHLIKHAHKIEKRQDKKKYQHKITLTLPWMRFLEYQLQPTKRSLKLDFYKRNWFWILGNQNLSHIFVDFPYTNIRKIILFFYIVHI